MRDTESTRILRICLLVGALLLLAVTATAAPIPDATDVPRESLLSTT